MLKSTPNQHLTADFFNIFLAPILFLFLSFKLEFLPFLSYRCSSVKHDAMHMIFDRWNIY